MVYHGFRWALKGAASLEISLDDFGSGTSAAGGGMWEDSACRPGPDRQR